MLWGAPHHRRDVTRLLLTRSRAGSFFFLSFLAHLYVFMQSVVKDVESKEHNARMMNDFRIRLKSLPYNQPPPSHPPILTTNSKYTKLMVLAHVVSLPMAITRRCTTTQQLPDIVIYIQRTPTTLSITGLLQK